MLQTRTNGSYNLQNFRGVTYSELALLHLRHGVAHLAVRELEALGEGVLYAQTLSIHIRGKVDRHARVSRCSLAESAVKYPSRSVPV